MVAAAAVVRMEKKIHRIPLVSSKMLIRSHTHDGTLFLHHFILIYVGEFRLPMRGPGVY
jgi:hypothetical protein